MMGLYIHIPFCKKICTYCDFPKFVYNEKWVYAYLKSLEKEIKDRYLDDVVDTIYIGGGTPSVLKTDEIRQLLDLLKYFKIKDNAEFTFECNLEDINEELLLVLKYYKVNRLSIGIESFQKKNLELMNRTADFKDAVNKIKLCRKYGFNNINVDLMYAFPNETLKDLKKDLDLFIKLNCEHISTYSLIINENTQLYINGITEIEEELDYDMYNLICKKLNNYNHYEISNFALKGYECKHNLIYWDNFHYYGFGLGASGYIDKLRYTNTTNLKDYLLGNYVKEKEFVTKDSDMKYEVMLGFRKLQGIKKIDFENKFHISIFNVFELDKLIKNKDLINKKEYIYINPDKLYIMNEILIKII